MVQPRARAAVAAGGDGLIIEVHPHPEVALSDGDQSLTPKNFNRLMEDLGKIAAVMERTV
jgi:3-deoxy-7-phosphoheptulonate synthase